MQLGDDEIKLRLFELVFRVVWCVVEVNKLTDPDAECSGLEFVGRGNC